MNTSFRSLPSNMRFKLLLLLPCFLYAQPGYFEPWGKDADMLHVQRVETPPKLSVLGLCAKKIIHFHQNVISPVDGPRSHYRPSSSNYMLQAIEQHGFLKGYLMGCDRLLRENEEPWVYRTKFLEGQLFKWDPPP